MRYVTPLMRFSLFRAVTNILAPKVGTLHFAHLLEHRQWGSVGKRFDWFTRGSWGIVEGRSAGIERFVCITGLCTPMVPYVLAESP